MVSARFSDVTTSGVTTLKHWSNCSRRCLKEDGGAENAGVENVGAIKHGKPSEVKYYIQYQWFKLKRIGLSQAANNGVYKSRCVRTRGLSSCAVHEFTQKVRTTHVCCGCPLPHNGAASVLTGIVYALFSSKGHVRDAFHNCSCILTKFLIKWLCAYEWFVTVC